MTKRKRRYVTTVSFDPLDPLKMAPVGESRAANTALRDYAHMGPHRSLRALARRYAERSASDPQAPKPPTTKVSTMFTWSKRCKWQERMQVYDEIVAEDDAARLTERRRLIQEQDWLAISRIQDHLDRMHEAVPAFITRRVKRIPGEPSVANEKGEIIKEGTPDQEIISLALNTTDLARLEKLRADLAHLVSIETEIDEDAEGPVRVKVTIGGLSESAI